MENIVGKLSVVATPIGNMGDITMRALETLKNCDLVVAEDTRVTGKLLAHYNIKKPLLSFHSQSKLKSTDKILENLTNGMHLCLVSDAGTPTISDPGSLLVAQIRKVLPELKIEAIPGPSAVICALSISGVHTENFVFYGFLPHKKGRQTMLKEILSSDKTSVFYESTHRVVKALQEIESLGHDGKIITVCKELTKMHENVIQGSANYILGELTKDSKLTKGEFVVIVSNI